jgi:diguanylate cyclase (GGDEF)-like protein
MTAYQPPVRAVPADAVFHGSFTRVLVDPGEVPNLRQMVHPHAAGTWIGIPLLAESQVFGILSVVSPSASRYGQNEITLAQTFARSIESAHIFNKASIQASIDPLTGICNRRSLFQLAQREFDTAAFVSSSLAVLMIDVDHFKRVNDNFGHAGGDVVLRAIAEMCQKHTRSLDLLGRYGGEEFILVLPDTLPNHAHQIAERLRQEISEMVTPTDQGDVRVQVSIGLACLDDTCPDLETLVKHSDQALYQAKQRGRNRVETWSAVENGGADVPPPV